MSHGPEKKRVAILDPHLHFSVVEVVQKAGIQLPLKFVADSPRKMSIPVLISIELQAVKPLDHKFYPVSFFVGNEFEACVEVRDTRKSDIEISIFHIDKWTSISIVCHYENIPVKVSDGVKKLEVQVTLSRKVNNIKCV